MDCRKGCLKIEAGLRRGIIHDDGRPVAQHEGAICQRFVDDRKCAFLDLKKDRTAGCTGKGSTNFEIDASHSSPWASYYLRDDQTVIQSGSLLYYLSPDLTREPYASRLKSAGILVTDAGSGFGTTPIWSNSHYSVYSVGRAEANATPR
jgi:hypothetical protein